MNQTAEMKNPAMLKRVGGGVLVLAAATSVLGLSSLPASAASPTHPAISAPTAVAAGPFSAQEEIEKSYACTSKADKKKKRKFNVHVTPAGTFSTTVYFNNHCSGSRHWRVHYRDGGNHGFGWSKCFTVHKHTKGKKKVGGPGLFVDKLTSPKKCS